MHALYEIYAEFREVSKLAVHEDVCFKYIKMFEEYEMMERRNVKLLAENRRLKGEKNRS